MRIKSNIFAISILALALTACGGGGSTESSGPGNSGSTLLSLKHG